MQGTQSTHLRQTLRLQLGRHGLRKVVAQRGKGGRALLHGQLFLMETGNVHAAGQNKNMQASSAQQVASLTCLSAEVGKQIR